MQYKTCSRDAHELQHTDFFYTSMFMKFTSNLLVFIEPLNTVNILLQCKPTNAHNLLESQ